MLNSVFSHIQDAPVASTTETLSAGTPIDGRWHASRAEPAFSKGSFSLRGGPFCRPFPCIPGCDRFHGRFVTSEGTWSAPILRDTYFIIAQSTPYIAKQSKPKPSGESRACLTHVSMKR